MPGFEADIEEMKKLTKGGFEDMLHCHPRHWCIAYFNREVKCDITDNNLIEVFNGMIVEYRKKKYLFNVRGYKKICDT